MQSVFTYGEQKPEFFLKPLKGDAPEMIYSKPAFAHYNNNKSDIMMTRKLTF